ncbi:MAG: hypothetical protein CMP47_09490 [Rickettsiales bacterium]|nr:hypothetical protein [Rickettsiales bacterium]
MLCTHVLHLQSVGTPDAVPRRVPVKCGVDIEPILTKDVDLLKLSPVEWSIVSEVLLLMLVLILLVALKQSGPGYVIGTWPRLSHT